MTNIREVISATTLFLSLPRKYVLYTTQTKITHLKNREKSKKRVYFFTSKVINLLDRIRALVYPLVHTPLNYFW